MESKNFKIIFLGVIFLFSGVMTLILGFYYSKTHPLSVVTRPKPAATVTQAKPVVKAQKKIEAPKLSEPTELPPQPEEIALKDNASKGEIMKKEEPQAQGVDIPVAEENTDEQDLEVISLNSLVSEAQRVYDDSEKERREGILWVDKSTSQIIVTLGLLQGVEPGSYLTVYDQKGRIGQVKVEMSLDVVSYVRPLKEGDYFFADNYYRAVLE